MPSYPRRDQGAVTGSNIAGGPLLAVMERDLRAQAVDHQRLARDQHQQSRKLFSSRDLRHMASIAGDVDREWRQASMEVDGDSVQIDALKAAARRKLDRRIGREVPGMVKARSLRRRGMRDHAALSAQALARLAGGGAHVGWGDATATLTDCAEFVAPFTSFDVQTVDSGGFVVRDDSFAKPQIGHLVNNFDYDQDENTSFSDGLLGQITHASASNWAACGVAFSVPTPGRLQISAALRNVHNRIMYSVTDQFGFSDAEVDILLRLFVAVVRGTKVIFLPTLLRHTGLVSHGSDLAYAESSLDDVVPYTVSATTTERFEANETVLVLAGSNVIVETVIDDMHCRVNAVLWWHLQKLCIGVAEDVFT